MGEISHAIYTLQWQCCGVKDFMDYRNSTYLVNLGNKVKPKAVLSWACCHTATNVKDALSDNGLLEVTADDRGNNQMDQ